ncbi:MAG: hypothetical protein A2170_01620 [Deltaproteobacteria bacterium RBG_13_53_10]|nr:MAG: hypothetical protein A2170_01620 [Deltaproteobacteria bacterium RBG_13_53_10]
MKRLLFVLIVLFTVVAFAAGAVAAEKKATKPPVTSVSGTASTYIPPIKMSQTPGTISVKDAKDKDWTFDVPADAKITGEVKRGDKVKVTYKTEASKMTATSITLIAVKKPAAPKK